MLRKIIFGLVFCAVIFSLTPSFAAIDYAENFEVYLNESKLETHGDTPFYKGALMSFYKSRDYEPVWFNEKDREIEDIGKFKDLIHKQAYINGLEPTDYNFDYILETQTAENNTDYLFEREWLLTNMVMHYLNDIRTGRIDPTNFDAKIMVTPQYRNLEERMEKALRVFSLKRYLESLAPQHTEYQQLRDKLAIYRKIQEKGGWPEVNIDTTLRPGESHEAVPQLRHRLSDAVQQYDGELPEDIWIDNAQLANEKLVDRLLGQQASQDNNDTAVTDENSELVYDAELAKRVAEFQYFHGKKADGVVGPKTLKVLNEPIESHIDKIKLSMERWRWLPDDLGEKHIRVNIASFYVKAIEDENERFVMPAIVGQVAHQTPVFSSVIKNVKMHPDWTSPDSISKRYVIPKIQKNPDVIHSLGYQLQDKKTGETIPWSNVNIDLLDQINLRHYQFRQKPGNNNALGLARFSIENNMSIFMHGTPSIKLFNEDDRTYSSGCVRLEDPLKMAKFLLEDKMSDKEIENLYYVENDENIATKFIDLTKEVPVHLVYMTAWVDQEGHIHFADDVYGRDKRLANALKRLN